MSLTEYRKKRKFTETTEPKGVPGSKEVKQKIFVVQKHQASHLHFDFRLEDEGVLKSWAVPKGPPTNPNDRRLAVQVEDHPLEYAKFHGKIPEGNYGAGQVEIWDKGTYETIFRDEEMWEIGLKGKKLKGGYALVRLKPDDKYGKKTDKNWLMIKKKNNAKKIIKKSQSAEFGKIEPMMATLTEVPFDDKDWVFEIKWDGYRTIAKISKEGVKLSSRNQQSFTNKFAEITEELKNIKHDVVLDGEVVALDQHGKPSFQLLQDYEKNKQGQLVYYVFDILNFDGNNIEKLPLVERRKILEKVIPGNGRVSLSEQIKGRGKDFFEAVKKQGLEGMVAKRLSSPYRQGERGRDWLKIKTHMRQEAVIVGYTEPKGSRNMFGALMLGIYKNGKLNFVGSVGTGFDEKTIDDLFNKLKKITRKNSPFEIEPETNSPVTWVDPKLVCEVKFAEWTRDGLMRQPVFLGLREDKKSNEIVKETPRHFSTEAPTVDDDKEIVIGKQRLKVTNLDKVFWPEEGITKGDLINYYRKIAPVLLPYLKDRPESLLRYPDGIEGENFYHKDLEMAPSWVKKTVIKSEEDKKVHYVLCQNEATLVYLINLGCIDLNPWSSRIKNTRRPDYMIIDLDPEEIGFEKVVEVALAVHEVMEKAKIPNFVKTSGASGIHIYSPLGAEYTYDQARNLALIIGHKVNEKIPKITSLERSPDKRKGKVYLDCFQNARGQTLATPYSVRAKPSAPVSTPLEWKEVNSKLTPTMFNMQNIFDRIQKKGDLFRPVLGKGFDMKKALDHLEV